MRSPSALARHTSREFKGTKMGTTNGNPKYSWRIVGKAGPGQVYFHYVLGVLFVGSSFQSL